MSEDRSIAEYESELAYWTGGDHAGDVAAVLFLSGRETDWWYEAACAGVEQTGQAWVEFPEAVARSICKSCPVRIPCLNYAMSRDIRREQVGVYGGRNLLERFQITAKLFLMS